MTFWRMKQHQNDVDKGHAIANALAERCLNTDENIDWNSATLKNSCHAAFFWNRYQSSRRLIPLIGHVEVYLIRTPDRCAIFYAYKGTARFDSLVWERETRSGLETS